MHENSFIICKLVFFLLPLWPFLPLPTAIAYWYRVCVLGKKNKAIQRWDISNMQRCLSLDMMISSTVFFFFTSSHSLSNLQHPDTIELDNAFGYLKTIIFTVTFIATSNLQPLNIFCSLSRVNLKKKMNVVLVYHFFRLLPSRQSKSGIIWVAKVVIWNDSPLFAM